MNVRLKAVAGQSGPTEVERQHVRRIVERNGPESGGGRGGRRILLGRVQRRLPREESRATVGSEAEDGDQEQQTAEGSFREIYYNRSFPWGTGGNPSNVDIQSVAIHEAGHAFGLGHFGKVFIKNNGTLQFAPKAIMNAVYVSEDRAIRGTDNASFCRIWANSH